MQQVIAVKIAGSGELIDESDRRPWTIDHCDRHRAVQRHDWGGLQSFEKIVEPDDLRPVRVFSSRGPTMQGRDRRLHGKRTGLGAERFPDEWHRFGDLLLIPEAAILFFERDEIAGLIHSGSAP